MLKNKLGASLNKNFLTGLAPGLLLWNFACHMSDDGFKRYGTALPRVVNYHHVDHHLWDWSPPIETSGRRQRMLFQLETLPLNDVIRIVEYSTN